MVSNCFSWSLIIILFYQVTIVLAEFYVQAAGGSLTGNGGYCVKLATNDGYDSGWACATSPQFGTCLDWDGVVDAGKICSKDGVFCWDFTNSDTMMKLYYANTFYYLKISNEKEKVNCHFTCEHPEILCPYTFCEVTGYKCGI